MRRGFATVGVMVCLLASVLSVGAADASGYRKPLVHEPQPSFEPDEEWLMVNAQQQIEGACGVTLVPPFGPLYVSDYYHHAVDSFSLGGTFGGSMVLPGGDSPIAAIKQSNSACGLAADADGNLYANEYHQRVIRLKPTEAVIDPGYATGVAVDEAGNLYVDHRTYVSVYEAPVEPDEDPVETIGLGSLGDAYGVAVDSKAGRVYVPDASDETVKVYEPAVDPANPAETIAGPAGGGFNSLTDTSLAVDPSSTEGEGHLLVVDNLKPLFERPAAAVYEFDSSGNYLDRLQTRTVGPIGVKRDDGPIFGEPAGIAVAPDGTVYVTTGNTELANVLAYGPFQPFAPPASSGVTSTATGGGDGAGTTQALSPQSSGSAAAPTPLLRSTGNSRKSRASGSGGQRTRGGNAKNSGAGDPRPRGQTTLVQNGPIRAAVTGGIAPTRLPRHGAAPVSVTIGGHISSTDPQTSPQLRRVSFAFNRAGRLDTRGLTRCHLSDIDPSSTRQALEICRSALVGEGRFAANVRLPEQSPFPSAGKVTAFNGVLGGKQVVFAHIYGTKPVPTSVVLPLYIRHGAGRFATRLEASLAGLTGDWGYVESIELRLGRRFRAAGESRSFLSAGCPAPSGFPGSVFSFARATFDFIGGRTLTATLTRNCTVRR